MKRKNSLKVFFGIVLFSSFFLTGFVGASDSFSEVEFSLSGCIFQFDESRIGVAVGECSVGENSFGDYSGLFFCDTDKIGYMTNETGIGCSWGEDSYELGTARGACCPVEFPSCVEIEDGLFQCQQRSISCETTLNADDCTSADGYFYEGECVCARTEKSCDIYTDSVACGNDVMNIGSIGIGRSEYCDRLLECGGTVFSVYDCGCSWNPDSGTGGACEDSISAVESFSGETRFDCSRGSYDDGECGVDGFRNVSWTSVPDVIIGNVDDVPEECFKLLGCRGGDEILSCGSTLVKLPGFSLFALLLSLFVIGIYYFVSGKFKYKKRFVL